MSLCFAFWFIIIRRREALDLESLEDPNQGSSLMKLRNELKTIVKITRVYFPGRFETDSLKKDLLIELQLLPYLPSVDSWEEMDQEVTLVVVQEEEDIIWRQESMDMVCIMECIINSIMDMLLLPIQRLQWNLIYPPNQLLSTQLTGFSEVQEDPSLTSLTMMKVSQSYNLYSLDDFLHFYSLDCVDSLGSLAVNIFLVTDTKEYDDDGGRVRRLWFNNWGLNEIERFLKWFGVFCRLRLLF